MSTFDDEVTWQHRCGRIQQVLAEVRADMVSQHLAEISGEFDDDTLGERGDRIYRRLEAMPRRDLSLAVVLLLHPDTAAEAQRLWLQLHAMTPEDIR